MTHEERAHELFIRIAHSTIALSHQWEPWIVKEFQRIEREAYERGYRDALDGSAQRIPESEAESREKERAVAAIRALKELGE